MVKIYTVCGKERFSWNGKIFFLLFHRNGIYIGKHQSKIYVFVEKTEELIQIE